MFLQLLKDPMLKHVYLDLAHYLKDCQPIQNHPTIRVLLKEGVQNNMYVINMLKSFQNILT